MNKTGRNDPCPCGSGKKYKQCCLPAARLPSAAFQDLESLKADVEKLDTLSNSVIDLVDAGEFDKAEAACRSLLENYPDQVDGLDRLAMVYEAKGEHARAAEYYTKVVEFAQSHPEFDQEFIDWAKEKAQMNAKKVH